MSSSLSVLRILSREFVFYFHIMSEPRTTRLSGLILRAVQRHKIRYGMTDKEIAEQSGISPSQFSEILKQKVRLGTDHVDKILEGLNLTLRELVLSDEVEGVAREVSAGLDDDEALVLGKVVSIMRTKGRIRESLLSTIELFDRLRIKELDGNND